MKISHPLHFKQNGAASLVFVMLVSLVIFASSAKMFKDMKNTQEIGTAVNAVSHADSGTKLAAEAFGIYLEGLTPNQLRTMPATIQMETDPNGDLNEFGVLSAENINAVEPMDNMFEVTATLVSRHQAARSSARLQVVYNVEAPGAPPPPPVTLPGEIFFGSSVTINGGINLSNNGQAVDLVVDGDVDIQQTNVNPINQLQTTGSVKIGSSVTVNSIFSDENVVLENTTTNLVRAGGTITASNATVNFLHANDDITATGGKIDEIASRNNINLKGGNNFGLITAGRDINVTNYVEINTARAAGDIFYNAGWLRAKDTVAEGNISCSNTGWNAFNSLSANGTIGCLHVAGKTHEGQSNTVNTPDEITPISIQQPVINVWALRNSANYIVEYDTATNRIVVTVNNVEGLTSGTQYVLANYNHLPGSDYREYLCEVDNGSGRCITPTAPTLPLCFGHSLNNTCITYDVPTKTFKFDPTTTAPGAMWFDGNVTLRNGHGVTSILATGNISTEGGFQQWAANRGAYEFTCNGNPSNAPGQVQQRYKESYSNHYPTNLCDKSSFDYTPQPIGNIAMAAGGFNPDTSVNPNGEFSGGDISLGASTKIEGSVLAGNIIATSGNVEIKGLVIAAAQQNNATNSGFGGSTVIDFQSNGDFNPLIIPDMAPVGPPAAAVGLSNIVGMAWSRPL